jgi:hypothetical protein
MTTAPKMHAWECSCGTRNAPSLNHCHKCGQPLTAGKPLTSAPARRCACGSLEEPGAAFCRVCGKSLHAPAPLAASSPPVTQPATVGEPCRRCRQPLKPGWEYCEACGKLQDPIAGLRILAFFVTLALLWGGGLWASGSINPLLQLRYLLRFILG